MGGPSGEDALRLGGTWGDISLSPAMPRVYLPPPAGCHGPWGQPPMVPMAPGPWTNSAGPGPMAPLGIGGVNTGPGPMAPPLWGGEYSREEGSYGVAPPWPP